MLYISKIPTIFQAGFLCAQSAIAETTPDGAERMQALGRLTVAYTIGSIIGPSLGGFLGSTGDYYFGAQLAVMGSFLSVFLCLFMSAEHDPTTRKTTPSPADSDSDSSATNSKKNSTGIVHVLEKVWVLLATKTITSVANSMAAATLPLVLKNTYGMQEAGMGMAMSVMSGFNALVNSVLLSPIAKWHGDNLLAVTKNVLLGMAVVYGVQCLCAGYTFEGPLVVFNGLYPYIITSIIISMHQYVLSTVITAESTALVDEREKGTLLGMEHSLFAAARIVSPQAGVAVLASHGVAGVSGACGAVFVFVLVAFNALGPHIVGKPGGSMCLGEKKEK
jgi:MFS family permease